MSNGMILSEADTSWLIRNAGPVALAFGSHVWLSPGQPDVEALLAQHWLEDYARSYT